MFFFKFFIAKPEESMKTIKLYENNGWEIVKEYANGSAKMKKSKSIGDLFENEVWNIFYKIFLDIFAFDFINCIC